jgi:hypothetical protein
MLLFLPPIVQALIGVAVLGAGVATHLPILDAIGCVGIAVGGYRWQRKRRDGGAIK